MTDILLQTSCWGALLSCAGFLLGDFLRKRFRSELFNPILFSVAISVGFIIFLGIDYNDYRKSAEPLEFLLTPATVALAVPLYEKLREIRKNFFAIVVSLTAGLSGGMACVLAMSVLFGLDHTQYATLLPKSITTPIGLGVALELNAIVPLTLTAIIATGIFGNMTAAFLCRIFRVSNPVAKGLAIGNASHIIGTLKAFEMGKLEGAMSSVAVLLAGMITVLFATLFAALY